jgi:ATP-dependent DNA ligase
MATRKKPSDAAIVPPIEPMLAKVALELPRNGAFLFEPKWDGFRAIVFRTDSDVFIQSRDLRPLDRYFPDLHEALLDALPKGSVLDGEIVIATAEGLDFDALQLRLHPAASRVAKLAHETPASFIAFDPSRPRGPQPDAHAAERTSRGPREIAGQGEATAPPHAGDA